MGREIRTRFWTKSYGFLPKQGGMGREFAHSMGILPKFAKARKFTPDHPPGNSFSEAKAPPPSGLSKKQNLVARAPFRGARAVSVKLLLRKSFWPAGPLTKISLATLKLEF